MGSSEFPAQQVVYSGTLDDHESVSDRAAKVREACYECRGCAHISYRIKAMEVRLRKQ